MFEINNDTTLEKRERLRLAYQLNETQAEKKTYAAESVTIFVSSDTNLAPILETFRNSIWWNHEAKFLVSNNDLENSCDVAEAFLQAVWAFNILSVVYLCTNAHGQSSFYNFNPYSDLAPKFWNKVRNDVAANKYWTVFEHGIEESGKNVSSYRKFE